MNQARSALCLSDFAVDRVVAGELARGPHLTECAACARRLRDAEDARARFQARPLPEFLSATPIGRSRVRALGSRAVLSAPILAVAAAMLFLVRPMTRDVTGATERVKGRGDEVGFYVGRPGQVALGGPGERVHPGDSLQIVTRTTSRRWIAVLSVDGAKNVSVYFPDGSEGAAVFPGRDVPLPVSTVLDDVLGDEQVTVVLCDAPFAIDPLRRALLRDPRAPLPLPDGCDAEPIALTKVPAP